MELCFLTNLKGITGISKRKVKVSGYAFMSRYKFITFTLSLFFLSNSFVYGKESTRFGTAFAVSEDGYLITSLHVVKDTKHVKAFSSNSKQLFTGEVIAIDPKKDLAIIKISTKVVPLKFSGFLSVPTGLEVYALGFPQPTLQGRTLKISSGLINAREGFTGETQRFQFSAEIQQGHSGGPVIAPDGTVVGLIQGKLISSPDQNRGVVDSPQNVNFALDSSLILNFLTSHKIPYVSSQLSFRVIKPAYIIFEETSPSVFFVEAESLPSKPREFSAEDISIVSRKIIAGLNKNEQSFFLGALRAGFKEAFIGIGETFLLEPRKNLSGDNVDVLFRSIISFRETKIHSRGFKYKSVIFSSRFNCEKRSATILTLEYKPEVFGAGSSIIKLRRKKDVAKTEDLKSKRSQDIRNFLYTNLCVN